MDDILVVVGTIVLIAAAVIIGAAAYDHSYRKRGREAIARAAEAHGADFSRSNYAFVLRWGDLDTAVANLHAGDLSGLHDNGIRQFATRSA